MSSTAVLPDGVDRRRLGMYDHALSDRRGTGRGQAAHFIDFDDAKTAAAVRLKVGVVTEGGNVNTGPPRRLQDGRAFRRFDLNSIDCQFNRFHDKSPVLQIRKSNHEAQYEKED